MSSPDRSILLSIKPRFAEAILDGTKTIELRRTPPRLYVPTDVLLYASQPTSAIVGTCQVTDILCHSTLGLWRLIGSQTAVTYDEYRAYFNGSARAYGLVLTAPRRLDTVVSLPTLRKTWDRFHPPQSFRYLTRSSSDQVLALAH